MHQYNSSQASIDTIFHDWLEVVDEVLYPAKLEKFWRSSTVSYVGRPANCAVGAFSRPSWYPAMLRRGAMKAEQDKTQLHCQSGGSETIAGFESWKNVR